MKFEPDELVALCLYGVVVELHRAAVALVFVAGVAADVRKGAEVVAVNARQKALSLCRGDRREPGDVDDRRRYLCRFGQIPESQPRREQRRAAEDKGHVQDFVVEVHLLFYESVLPQLRSVVAKDDDEGVIENVHLPQAGEYAAQVVVGIADIPFVQTVIGVAPHIPPGLRRVPRFMCVVHVDIDKAGSRFVVVPKARQDELLGPVHVLIIQCSGAMLVEAAIETVSRVGAVVIAAVDAGERAIAVRPQMLR